MFNNVNNIHRSFSSRLDTAYSQVRAIKQEAASLQERLNNIEDFLQEAMDKELDGPMLTYGRRGGHSLAISQFITNNRQARIVVVTNNPTEFSDTQRVSGTNALILNPRQNARGLPVNFIIFDSVNQAQREVFLRNSGLTSVRTVSVGSV